jgi:hypothetical protein
MGRAYAGILGPLACAIMACRGILSGAGVEESVLAASAALAVFALVGYLAGSAAELIVRDAVQTTFQSALADWEKNHTTQSKPTT